MPGPAAVSIASRLPVPLGSRECAVRRPALVPFPVMVQAKRCRVEFPASIEFLRKCLLTISGVRIILNTCGPGDGRKACLGRLSLPIPPFCMDASPETVATSAVFSRSIWQQCLPCRLRHGTRTERFPDIDGPAGVGVRSVCLFVPSSAAQPRAANKTTVCVRRCPRETQPCCSALLAETKR